MTKVPSEVIAFAFSASTLSMALNHIRTLRELQDMINSLKSRCVVCDKLIIRTSDIHVCDWCKETAPDGYFA